MNPNRSRFARGAGLVLACLVLASCGGGATDTATSTPGTSASPPPPPQPVPVAPAGVACANFYTAGFALDTSRTTATVTPLAKPAKGVAFSEPNYNTCMVRATDHVADGVNGFTRNDYSRRQAFNADSTRYLAYSLNGAWHVYDANTYARIKALPGLAGDAEAQWHPTHPNLLYYLPTNGVGMKLNELTVSSGSTRVVGDFATRLRARWPTANFAWTKSEGSPSANGRYWCFMVDDASFGTLGVFTWDRDTDTLLGSMNTNGERPDHVSMSPSGNHCVVSGDGARGTVAYTRDFSQQRLLLNKSEHSDLAIDANGDDVYVSVDYQSNAGDIFMLNLRTGVRTALFPNYVAGSATALHVSGKAFNKPGWVLLSTYAETLSSSGVQWLHRKIFAVKLEANPTIYNIAFHRSIYNGYWTEPHASVNRDFTKILFSSNWQVNNAENVDAYMVEIPATALR